MATIGALNAVLSMETTAFIADTQKARAALGSFTAQANTQLASFDKGVTRAVRGIRTMTGLLGYGFGATAFLSVIRSVASGIDGLEKSGKVSAESAAGVRKLTSAFSDLKDEILSILALPLGALGQIIPDKVGADQTRVRELENRIRSLNAAGTPRNRVLGLDSSGAEVTIESLEKQLAALDARLLASTNAQVPFRGLVEIKKPGAVKAGKAESRAEMMQRIGLPEIGAFDFQEAAANLAIEKARGPQQYQGLQLTNLTPASIDIDQIRANASSVEVAWVESLQNIDDAAASVAYNMEAAFDQFVATGKISFTGLVQSIIADLARLSFQQAITGPLTNALSGFLVGLGGGGMSPIGLNVNNGGGFDFLNASVNSQLTGARASGGPVSAGGLYLVGENGPELFSPSQSGSIIPNGAGGSTIYIDARGAVEGVDQQIVKRLREALPGVVGASVQATRAAFPGMMANFAKRQG